MPKTTALSPETYINRELSLLRFQRRVLEEAKDENNPLLERVRFLSILGSNMDEFFMVRVAGIRKLVGARIGQISPDGLSPRDELAAIRRAAITLYKEAHRCLHSQLLPQLDKAGIHVLNYSRLSKTQKAKADTYFKEVVYPILTPLALGPGHPFPHISNLSLNLALVVRDPAGKDRFARLKVPHTLPRLVPIKRSSGAARKDGTVSHHHYFVWLEQVIAANAALLFPGMEILESHPFRVIRDGDIGIQEIEADDLLAAMQQGIRRRKFGSVAKIAIHGSMPASIRALLVENLRIRPTDVYTQGAPLGLVDLEQLCGIERYDLKYPPYKARLENSFKPPATAEDVFSAIREQNILLHFPYDSFTPVVDFLKLAARDPQVLAIKQTLYRVGRNSPVVDALLEASERGKQVAVLVELKARFDEESNIGWARKLEQAGVHVVYGLVDLKIHSKIAMVVRQEPEGIRRYLHLATGNYNTITSNTYEDIGIFTSDEAMGADASELFNFLTGYAVQQEYRKLLVAPLGLREKLTALIRQEMEHAKAGEHARLIFKVNSLVDPDMVAQLYKASQAGVKVDLLVRGICCLRPGVKGLSNNIRVISVMGRFLEHSRIFYFYNQGQEQVYLGSADLMGRNLDHRVEVVFPVESEEHVRYLRDSVLKLYLKDNSSAHIMHPDGSYRRLHPGKKAQRINVQECLMAGPGCEDLGPEAQRRDFRDWLIAGEAG
jgi:polyphosphate kinase